MDSCFSPYGLSIWGIQPNQPSASAGQTRTAYAGSAYAKTVFFYLFPKKKVLPCTISGNS